ncbi:unnamed protein product [Hermetia illucens]|uniref:Uncharacterized protein n=1 Tax=Hermetia illucens TaxID=343691 RepID=A0A7R8UQQ7_HERIL|nr:unnamed protein product [Hermetia illucens]
MCFDMKLILIAILTFTAVGSAQFRKDSEDSILNGLSWECANNASCVNGIALSVISRFDRREPIDFGLFSINPAQHSPVQGRSNKFLEFLSGNAIRIPMGPMVFSVQQSEQDSDYLEVALLKSVAEQGRGRKRVSHKEKKQLQLMIPMFLAANAVGWTLFAVKAVGVLTVKALLMSKLALLVATGIIVKRLMEKASEKMMLPPYLDHHPEHHPYLMPYNMEYALPSHPIAAADVAHVSHDDLYSIHVANPHEMTSSAIGQMVAESSLSHAIEHPNGTSPQVALAGGAYKVKRDDTEWAVVA